MEHPRSRKDLRHHELHAAALSIGRAAGAGAARCPWDALLRRRRSRRAAKHPGLAAVGFSLERIQTIRAGETELVSALQSRVRELTALEEKVQRQIRSVQLTIDQLTNGVSAMSADNFDGFDNSVYQEEVEERWGKDAYAAANQQWKAMSPEQQKAHQQEHLDIALEYQRLGEAGVAADASEAQAAAARHVPWLAVFTKPTHTYVVGLAEMYVADPRFAANYHGHAEYVRDALTVYADKEYANKELAQ